MVFTGPAVMMMVAVMMGEGMADPLPLQMQGVYQETDKCMLTDAVLLTQLKVG